MNLNVLPALCALLVFVFCFRPLVRRAGPHTNVWFLGWMFLLAHYAILMMSIPVGAGFRGKAGEFFCTATTELCALCFILAASKTRAARANKVLIAEIAVPLLLQAFLFAFGLASPPLHLWLRPRERSLPFNHLAAVFALFAVAEVAFFKATSDAVVDATLCILFLSAAYLTFAFAQRLSRGVLLMTGGLAVWAFTYSVQAAAWMRLKAHIADTLLDIPRYAAAAGMIVLLLDEYFQQAESLALHDPLTGLPNRRLFDARLEQAIEESQFTDTPVACLVIDVDKFKYINDTFGHPVGDGLLQALAKRLSWNLGPRDMLARTGGDEFTAILMEAADEYHIRFIAGAMMAAGCVPVSIDQHLIDVHISIGIAVAPRDAVEKAELHRVADEAMYRAKRRGGAGVTFAHEEINDPQPV